VIKQTFSVIPMARKKSTKWAMKRSNCGWQPTPHHLNISSMRPDRNIIILIINMITKQYQIHHFVPSIQRLIDWIKALHPTRHKIGHFRDIFPSQSLGLVLKNKMKHNKTKHASITTQNEHKNWSQIWLHPAWKQNGPILKEVDK